MSSNLAYYGADALGMTLYQIDGGLKAHEIRKLNLGPWRIDLPVKAVSDLITHKGISFWVTMAGLSQYLIVREHDVWLFVLSTGTLKVCGAKTSFEATTISKRIEEFKVAIRGAFRWHSYGEHKEEWKAMSYTASDFTIGG
jgi:hypothetical protein